MSVYIFSEILIFSPPKTFYKTNPGHRVLRSLVNMFSDYVDPAVSQHKSTTKLITAKYCKKILARCTPIIMVSLIYQNTLIKAYSEFLSDLEVLELPHIICK